MSCELLREAYPLTWPDRQKRTDYSRRRDSKFELELGRARDELLRELKLLGAENVVLSSNVPLRRDGLPYADTSEPKDPGVAVYFERRVGWDSATQRTIRKPFVIACDSYRKVKWNFRAVGVTVEALRTIQRHGASEMLEQAFTGFAALPPVQPKKLWWNILGVEEHAGPERIRAAYRELAVIHHPDKGGSAERMAEINVAYQEATGARA